MMTDAPGARYLIVDDDRAVRALPAWALRSVGQVKTAPDGVYSPRSSAHPRLPGAILR